MNSARPLPSAISLYANALLRIGRGSAAAELAAPLRSEPYTVVLDRDVLAAYNRHCGYPTGSFPLAYLYVLANGTQLALLNDPRCPYSAAGLVHRSVSIAWDSAAPKASPGRVRVQATLTDMGTSQDGGRNIQISCEIADESGILIGDIVSGFRVRGKGSKKATKSPLSTPASSGDTETIRFESGRGVAYAKLSGDWNPIHLSRLTARLFGFRRPVVHGLDMLSSVAARSAVANPRRIEARFRRPVLLPATTRIIRGGSPQEASFSLASMDNSVVHMEGTLFA